MRIEHLRRWFNLLIYYFRFLFDFNMNNDEIKELIKGWHYKAWNDDYFSKYSFQYLAFIAYVQRWKFNESNDRYAIQALKRDEGIKNSYIWLIQENNELSNARSIIKEELDSNHLGMINENNEVCEIKWRNCQWNNLNQKTNIEKEMESWVIHNLTDRWNMIEFRYSIRNTLFHWWKNANDRRDKLLVKYWFKTLRPLVDLFLDDFWQ